MAQVVPHARTFAVGAGVPPTDGGNASSTMRFGYDGGSSTSTMVDGVDGNFVSPGGTGRTYAIPIVSGGTRVLVLQSGQTVAAIGASGRTGAISQ